MIDYLERSKQYFNRELLPFWIQRLVEPVYGGFQTNYDRLGRRTPVTEKTLLAQARAIFSLSFLLRRGYNWPGSAEMIGQGLEFLFRHFRDPQHDGYFWIVDESGKVLDDRKVLYGFSFLIYGLSECALATGSGRAGDEAVRLFDLIRERSHDPVNGGYFEHFRRDFSLQSVRSDGGIHKSLDVHLHLMEAFSTLFELSGSPDHRKALEETIELIFGRMVHKQTGTGIAMFAPDWRPIPNQELQAVWGVDRFPEGGKAVEITSYGHNIELAWLYLQSLDVMGINRAAGRSRVLPIFEHTLERGVDREFGGLYVEGHREGEVIETNKEFWQQAEAMVGFLDAYLYTGEERFWEGFHLVHDFVFERMINREAGEWYALLSRDGEVIWDHSGHNWKTCYHTLRGCCLVVEKLEAIAQKKGLI